MDKYDEAIAYLTEHPDEIYENWNDPGSSPAGCLFQYCGRSYDCGCLTQVAGFLGRAATSELTDAIRADVRIPRNERDLSVDRLPALAEWQRRLDGEFGVDRYHRVFARETG